MVRICIKPIALHAAHEPKSGLDEIDRLLYLEYGSFMSPKNTHVVDMENITGFLVIGF